MQACRFSLKAFRIPVVLSTLGLVLAGCSREPENAADVVFSGGTVLTLVGQQPMPAQALAVTGGKISFIGSVAEAERLVGSKTQKINLQGGALMPPIVSGVSEVLLAKGASDTPNCWQPGRVVQGNALMDTLEAARDARTDKASALLCFGLEPDAQGHLPLAETDLDAAFPDFPVILVQKTMNGVLANTAAKRHFPLDIYKALQAATRKSDAATDAGLRVGQPAEFMVLDQNPLQATSVPSIRVTHVYAQGRLLPGDTQTLSRLALLDLSTAYAQEVAFQAEMKAKADAAAAAKKVAAAAAARQAQAAKLAQQQKSESKRSNQKKALAVKPAATHVAETAPAKPKEVRFNMTQGGKKMTPEDFEAWMKAQGIRIVPAKSSDSAVENKKDGK